MDANFFVDSVTVDVDICCCVAKARGGGTTSILGGGVLMSEVLGLKKLEDGIL